MSVDLQEQCRRDCQDQSLCWYIHHHPFIGVLISADRGSSGLLSLARTIVACGIGHSSTPLSFGLESSPTDQLAMYINRSAF